MPVKSIQITTTEQKRYNNNAQKNNTQNYNVSFGMNPVITLMDAIDRGGFMASFVLQDFLGMAAPRVGAGMYRNYDKTGELNWDFAKKEGIREILSGPSAFLIPAAMLFGIKRLSGFANNVPVSFINGFGDTFAEFAQNNKNVLTDSAKVKLGYYEDVFKNMLSASTNNALEGKELTNTAKSFAQRLVDAEKAPSKGFWKNLTGKSVPGSAQDLKQELLEDFVNLRKKHLGFNTDKVVAEYSVKGDKKIATSFKSILGNMKDYANDAIKTTSKKAASVKDLNIEEFVKTLSKRRSGTRFLSNVSMWLGVIGFYRLIPKLYNKATKGRDPGLDGLGVHEESLNETENPSFGNNNGQVAFTGLGSGFQKAMSGLGDAVTNSKGLSKLSSAFEFDGASMSMPAMLTLLFGFCLPPRLINAQSDTDRKEILFRDVTSFLAILFGAKTITRISSDIFAKESGLALNVKPANHNDNIFKKMWHYIYPSGGVQVLDDARIKANYSNLGVTEEGLNNMFRFVDKNGGNVGKMLNIDKNIKKAATEILGEAPNKNMKLADIIMKFDNAKNTNAYKKIVDTLADSSNKLVKRAKTYNSAFGFVSTIFLVPALMIWISRHCEKMTKKRIAEQKEASMKDMAKHTPVPESMQIVTNKPTMAGFLNNR